MIDLCIEIDSGFGMTNCLDTDIDQIETASYFDDRKEKYGLRNNYAYSCETIGNVYYNSQCDSECSPRPNDTPVSERIFHDHEKIWSG